MNRFELIDRKQQVIAEAQRLRRDVERLRRQGDDRETGRLIGRLERRIDELSAEEQRLRLQIDRTAR